ncbi:general odorant-binding protein 69-like [Culex pipiens pallens]|uniref:general odorant-binding protein 69-like n=1 Tax=Culex pipiens pallens TaxID=42434 RepID=UPI0019537A41|nr:general odorant-binding protein 69-like [Culex pipiens pallens]
MRTLISVVLFGLLSISTVQCRLPHYTIFKSFPQALQECAEYLEVSNCTLQRYVEDSYPNCEIVKKLLHCTLLNLVAWKEDSGVEHHVMVSFFEPAPQDTCYENRTAECVRNVLATCQDKLSQAYEVFQCYYRQYGNIRESKQWIPNTANEFNELISLAIELANVPRCERIQYARGNILDQPSFARAFMIGCVRAGYYSLQDGVYLSSFYTEFGVPEVLTKQTEECVAAVSRQYCDSDHTTRLYHIFKKCLADVLPTLSLVQQLQAQEVGTDLCGCE